MKINIDIKKKEICEQGTYPAVVAAIYDLGLQAGFEGGKPKQKVAVAFEVETGAEHNRLSRIYSVSMHEKADMRKLLRACRKHDLTEMEVTTGQLDLDEIIGKPCTVEVTHVISNGERKAKVENVSSAMANATPIKVTIDASIEPEWVSKLRSKALAA